VLSNADTPETRAAYALWHITEVKARRSVNSDVGKRSPVGELVVRGRWADDDASLASMTIADIV